MKKKRKYLIILIALALSACSHSQEKDTVRSEQTYPDDVKKHESEKLPVTIYMDSDYKIEGEQVGFQRTITNVSVKDFEESTEIEFYDRYDKAIRNQGYNLEDYKLLLIDFLHETEEEARSRPLEAFILNEGSGLVIGENELASQNEFLMYQQDFLVTDFKVSKTFDETGDIMMAIPNEYADDPNLQLRIKQQIDEEKKYIYIDLN